MLLFCCWLIDLFLTPALQSLHHPHLPHGIHCSKLSIYSFNSSLHSLQGCYQLLSCGPLSWVISKTIFYRLDKKTSNSIRSWEYILQLVKVGLTSAYLRPTNQSVWVVRISIGVLKKIARKYLYIHMQ